ncbi:MAG: hypothetical protein HOO67_03355 [Candidatus Peribacteraceae bacterium]|nr:hypothetical protein [Candidatus Peribacteraceae bacterium]
MLLPTSEAPEWNSDNASELKTFLSGETGRKVLEILAYFAPKPLDGSDVNKTLVSAGEVRGYTEAVEQIISLRTHRPPETEPKTENYPSLDDDSAWPEPTDNNA